MFRLKKGSAETPRRPYQPVPVGKPNPVNAPKLTQCFCGERLPLRPSKGRGALPTSRAVTSICCQRHSRKLEWGWQRWASIVAYYRVPTPKQARSGLGLEAQRHGVAEFLNGGDWRMVGEFIEVESGKKAKNRPELSKALALCRLHGAWLVIAKLDRFSRKCALPALSQGERCRLCLRRYAERKPLDCRHSHGRQKTRQSAFTKDALAAAKRRGMKLGDFRGAMPTARVAARVADLAPIIAELQEGVVTSLIGIAAALNERGIPTARGDGKWSSVQVMRVLERLSVAASSRLTKACSSLNAA